MLGPLRHGKGDHTCSSGDRYVGHWRYDKRDGRGRLVLAAGITYEGDWVDGHRATLETNLRAALDSLA